MTKDDLNAEYFLLITDMDLPPANRTEANMWKARAFEWRRELVNANRTIYKLQKKIKNISQKNNLEEDKK